MRNKHYKIKGIRMSEETYQRLKEKRKKSGLSWNLFLLELLKKK
jgi:predicted DNA-binding protein